MIYVACEEFNSSRISDYLSNINSLIASDQNIDESLLEQLIKDNRKKPLHLVLWI